MTQPRALNCPLCGGTLSPPMSSRRMTCPFCGKPLFYAGEEFLPRFAFASHFDDESLHKACHNLFGSAYVPKDLASRALLLQKRRSYVPFYLLTGKRGGVIAAGKERIAERAVSFEDLDARLPGEAGPLGQVQRWRSEKPQIVSEEDSRVVLGDFDYLYPACALENLDLLDLDVRQIVREHVGDFQPVLLSDLVRSGDVLDADLPLERIVEKGVASSQRTGELAVLEMQPALLYVPLVTLTFRYGRQVFSVTLEELSGSWVAGRLPFRKDLSFLLGLGIVSLLGLFAGRLGHALLTAPWASGPPATREIDTHFLVGLFGVLGFGLLVLTSAGLSAAWALVRAPYLVRLGFGSPRVEVAGPVPQSPLAPVNAFLRWFFGTLAEYYARKREGEP